MGVKEINVEVSLKLTSHLPASDPNLRENVANELKGKLLHQNSLIRAFDNDFLAEHVLAIRICELVVEESDSDNRQVEIMLDDASKINIFMFRLSEETPQSEAIGGDDDTLAANFLPLPARCLEGLWETLVYDSTIKHQLLQYSKAMLRYSKCGVDPNIINCNRVLLLHGPPGTGKTSLSRAIAQKLSIRLNSSYAHALLIEINTHCLFSKYFSESGKLVSKMFGKIRELAEDPKVLLCVLIDEVESLTHSRSASSHGSEPSDAIRVVNAVLTHLDLLKTYPNVLTLSTSNITNAIDLAFVDRADLCVLIPNPSAFGVYSILYSCIEELVKAGIIQGPCPPRIENHRVFGTEIETNGCNRTFVDFCRNCVGMSGRSLRKLPLRVHTSILQPEEIVSFEEFVKALALAAELVKKEKQTFNSSGSGDVPS
ncbi:thyroid hormone receptor interactor 13 [Nesidiocoris tenuis]|uniref:Thyroid hormone receptor interactor 13 n=1 Tax=Nesidiocoris tenuis TaxID=355587 RepID=A0ABN7ASP0_9HEMI|nr:thyroid hormone receptor interactor 13 [Nesidiocoris tenuis]